MVAPFDIFLATAVKLIAQGMENTSTIGDLKPTWRITERFQFYRAYEGIRYAHPPIGEDSFEAPRPVRRFDRVVKKKIDCMQIHPRTGKVIGGEDCLFLNVYVPGKFVDVSNKLPVMIWLQGTPFGYGVNTISVYDPMRFMDQGIIVVTLNYRVGILGFGCTMEMKCNLGLRDQQVAIYWVLNHIKKFGGDPDSITLAGHGAGASHVILHLRSAIGGQIKYGIALSGTRIAPWAISNQDKNAEFTQIGIGDCKGDQIAACLKNSSAEDIVRNAWTWINNYEWWINVTTPFGPTVEHGFFAYPSIYEWTGQYKLLLGFSPVQTSKSLGALFDRKAGNKKSIMFNQFLLEHYRVGHMKKNNENLPGFLYALKILYHDWHDSLAGIAYDGWFYYPAILEARRDSHLLQGMMFDYRGNPDCEDAEELLNRDELAYLFNIPGCRYTVEDRRIGRKYVMALADFVKTRNVVLKSYSEDKELYDFSTPLRFRSAYPANQTSSGVRMETWYYLNIVPPYWLSVV